eukprot:4829034-Pyramimonas_sp.AAC.1
MSSTTLRATASGLPPAEAARRAASTGSLATVVAHAHPTRTAPQVVTDSVAMPTKQMKRGLW